MVGAHPCSIVNRSREFSQRLTIPLDAARIRNSTLFLLIGAIEIAASALGNFDDRLVVVLRNFGYQVIDACAAIPLNRIQ